MKNKIIFIIFGIIGLISFGLSFAVHGSDFIKYALLVLGILLFLVGLIWFIVLSVGNNSTDNNEEDNLEEHKDEEEK